MTALFLLIFGRQAIGLNIFTNDPNCLYMKSIYLKTVSCVLGVHAIT